MSGHVGHLLSPYVDGELSELEVRRVDTHLAACADCRRKWEQIRAGATIADSVTRVEPPPQLWEHVQDAHTHAQRERVPVRSGTRVEVPRGASLPSKLATFPSKLATAGAIVALLLGAAGATLFLTQKTSPTSASAAAVLDTSDEAVKRIAKPGELLHRRWRFTRLVTKPGAAPERHDWFMDSWLGGPNLNRSVTRISSADGSLISVSLGDADGTRGHSYFSRDYPGELRGVDLEFPTDAERRQVLATLAPEDRARLAPLFEPRLRPASGSLLLWEHRANRALLTDPDHQPSAGQRIVLSLAPAVMADGEAAHRVTQLTLGTPWGDFRPDGTPSFQLARVTTHHYISKSSFLTLKLESDVDLEDGSRRVSSTVLESIQSVRADAAADPFAVSIPPGTPSVRVSTRAYLQALADVLRRSAVEVRTDTRAR